MNEMILHCFPESGGCYKAALMLALTGTPWRGVWVDYFATGQTRTPEWREGVSVMGEVPVLEDGGLVLSQSGVILHHLAERTGQFAPADPAEGREILRWILFDNHKFTSYLATWRFLLGWAKDPDPAVVAFFRARVEAAFAVAEKQLERHAFITGTRPTIADISMNGYLHYPEAEWPLGLAARYPAVSAWIGRMRALPGWRAPYELLPGPRTPPHG
ncbi:glutathione S-transferase [Roseomonas eburnea]|uniref:Glutathione S-transferase n=1 Tax=Neoroseomonas eburnea TaxID=1346889 RepID=A0A9X9XBX8_9PROT|nr:glutathione S-transferase [Neoroseomonas eburnea]MBR0681214.1 glutathione S-transferase [Neoroseomonas eburnea]